MSNYLKYLSDNFDCVFRCGIGTVTFVFGPQGSGKTHMIQSLLKAKNRKVLQIDLAPLSKVTTDAALVAGLAEQTGYWPVFSFLNSMNNLIDLASVGVIGQKGTRCQSCSFPVFRH